MDDDVVLAADEGFKMVQLGPFCVSIDPLRYLCCGNSCGGQGKPCPYPQTRRSWSPNA